MDAAVFSLVSVVAVLLALAGVALIALSARSAARAHQARRWPTAEGTVLRSRVVRHRGEGDDALTTFAAEVRYRYAVDGREYESHRVGFAQPATSVERHAAEVVARYPDGAQVEVHYDPAAPHESVLDTSAGVARLGPAVGAALVVVAATLWAAVRSLSGR